MTPRIGSLFTGYGGLDLAVEAYFGARTVWTSDIDPGASKIITHRMPHAPNLGDLTLVDWSAVEPIEILTGGFPCQDVSTAGKRAGLKPGTRSGLWSHMAYAIDQLRPRYVVAENVRGLLSAEAHSNLEPCPWCVGELARGGKPLRALGAVLGDLAELGYDATWIGLRAADVGAPHGRFRVFVVATDTERDRLGRRAKADPTRRSNRGGSRPATPGHSGDVATDAGSERHGRGEDDRALGLLDRSPAGEARQRERPREVAGDRGSAAPTHTPSDGRDEGRPESTGLVGGSDAAPGRGEVDWGPYGPAVTRWEAATGRVAPAPTETGPKGGQRLSPRFVEWMMGLPAGHVTDVPDLGRNAQLKALGNGVVPAQAYEALRRALT